MAANSLLLRKPIEEFFQKVNRDAQIDLPTFRTLLRRLNDFLLPLAGENAKAQYDWVAESLVLMPFPASIDEESLAPLYTLIQRFSAYTAQPGADSYALETLVFNTGFKVIDTSESYRDMTDPLIFFRLAAFLTAEAITPSEGMGPTFTALLGEYLAKKYPDLPESGIDLSENFTLSDIKAKEAIALLFEQFGEQARLEVNMGVADALAKFNLPVFIANTASSLLKGLFSATKENLTPPASKSSTPTSP